MVLYWIEFTTEEGTRLLATAPLFLGVDAGGTKTLALVATAGTGGRFCILGVGVAGPGNPLSSGLDQAMRSVHDAIGQARLQAGLSKQVISHAVIAIAGAANDAVRVQLTEQVDQAAFAADCQVVPDFTPLLAANRSTRACVGIIAGTGSVAFARGTDGAIHRSGGWGHLLGDEGSGWAIGRRALGETLRTLEEDRDGGVLRSVILESLAIASPDEILPTIYQAADPRRLVASLAGPILRVSNHCHAAQQLIDAECDALARVVARVVARAQLSDQPFDLCLGGGVLVGSTLVRQRLIAALQALDCEAENTYLVQEPAVECLALAAG